MRKGIFREKQKKLNFLIIISVLSLALLTSSIACCSDSNNYSSSHTGSILKPINDTHIGEPGFSKLELVPDENTGPLQEVSQYLDPRYAFGGIGAALFIILIYRYMASKEKEMIEKPSKKLYQPREITELEETKEKELVENLPKERYQSGEITELKEINQEKFDTTRIASKEKELIETPPKEQYQPRKITELEEIYQEKFDTTRTWLFILVPSAFIALAEFLIFAGKMKYAVGIHIGILIVLSLSNIFVKDLKVYRVYQALMLLPILRLVNLSMPIFFTTTLYTFVFVYAPLLISLAVIITHQQYSYEKVGITAKHLLSYVILSIPLGFLLGLGEYMMIHPQNLIPDLSIINMLKLTVIMVFFVGLTEELIFRSILQIRLSEAIGANEALIITCILFGFMHSGYGTFHEILYTGFVAFIIGSIFNKTKSLPFVAILHGFINVFLFGILPYYYLKGGIGF
jgi:membrane protease YdiL (CAAX protease family)